MFSLTLGSSRRDFLSIIANAGQRPKNTSGGLADCDLSIDDRRYNRGNGIGRSLRAAPVREATSKKTIPEQ